MRHVLVHGYFEVDIDLVWTVVENELAPLRTAMVTMAEGLGSGNPPVSRS